MHPISMLLLPLYLVLEEVLPKFYNFGKSSGVVCSNIPGFRGVWGVTGGVPKLLRKCDKFRAKQQNHKKKKTFTTLNAMLHHHCRATAML